MGEHAPAQCFPNTTHLLRHWAFHIVGRVLGDASRQVLQYRSLFMSEHVRAEYSLVVSELFNRSCLVMT